MAALWKKLKKSLFFTSSYSSKNTPPPSDSSPTYISNAKSNRISSSSSLSRISRSFSGTRSSKKVCAICLGSMKTGQGALFTAECSHSFHFNCIATNTCHGRRVCPICRANWKDVPFQSSSKIAVPQRNSLAQTRVSPSNAPLNGIHIPEIHHIRPLQSLHHSERQLFRDDEPLPAMSTNLTPATSLSCPKSVTVKAVTELAAVSASQSLPSIAVLVSVRAPPLREEAQVLARAPIDLVTVLDVSGSMAGSKLSLVKRAIHFVIESLGPSDRLSIVTFSSTANRIFPLRRMSDSGRDDAIIAVNSLKANGGTKIVEGLKKGVRVLEERRQLNPVASIILLSDGKDSSNSDNPNCRNGTRKLTAPNTKHILEYMNHLPGLICPSNRKADEAHLQTIPVHTFGFGADHDPAAMHAISDASGGTFSFIESFSKIQDAFAMCIGGLLSVVAQESRLTVRSISSGVNIGSMSSGRYKSEISEKGLQGVIDVGSLYADEQKEFLVCLSVPVALALEGQDRANTTPLLDVFCSYKDSMSNEMVQVEGERVVICRPEVLSPTDMTVCLEVDRQRNRLMVAKGIEEAQGLADMGKLEDARSLLSQLSSTLLASTSSQAGDALCSWLESELTEIREKMESMELYEHTGRAYVLSGLSSHSWQRATTRGDSTSFVMTREGGDLSTSTTICYETPSMTSMLTKSQIFERHQPQKSSKQCSLNSGRK